MRIAGFFLLLLLSTFAWSQRDFVYGTVTDEKGQVLEGVHVYNATVRKLSITNEKGEFRMIAQAGDSLGFSAVNQESLWFTLTEDDLKEDLSIRLKETLIELDELTIASIPSYDRFKEDIMEYQPKDTTDGWFYGLPKPVNKGDQMVQTDRYKNLGYVLFNPINYLHYSFSKKEKEKRKYYDLTQNKRSTSLAYNKFNRDWVSDITELKGDELTSFIAFCDFSVAYINATPLYDLRLAVLDKLEEFKNQGKG